VHGLSFGSRYFRFGRGDVEFSESEAAERCDPDHATCRHSVVVTDENGAEIVIASARFYIQPDGESCELTILVADAWQGTRVAHRLLTTLIEEARDAGLKRMYARVLASNTRMLKFAQRHGFAVAADTDNAAIKVLNLQLDRAGSAAAGI
jgi:L-amino acid N-acyltransferase YncA